MSSSSLADNTNYEGDIPTEEGVSLDEAEQGQTGEEKERSNKKDSLYNGANIEQVELFGRKKFFELRETWSSVIIIWIFVLIIFNISISFFVGTKTLDYTQYKWFTTSVTVETFLQIVGMGYVAVKFLFSDGKSVVPFEKITAATKREDS